MPKPRLKRGEMKEQTTVKIPFEHLSEGVKQAIGYSWIDPHVNSPFWPLTLQGQRGIRNVFRAASLTGVTASEALNKTHILSELTRTLIVGSISLVFNQMITAPGIQKAHGELKKAINAHGLLDTKFEGHYPVNWMSPAFVATTHPVFYVTGRGDLVFKKPTRLEHMRYLDQQRWYGKTGLLPWRWRVYLEPPKAPQKVRALKLAKRRVPFKFPGLEPAFAPAPRGRPRR